jgi:hypothetical protein
MWTNTLDLAKQCVVLLAKQYPSQVPEYCKPLLDKIETKQYVPPKLTFVPVDKKLELLRTAADTKLRAKTTA